MSDAQAWQEWRDTFQEQAELQHPAELHGLLTGLMTLIEPLTAQQWQQLLDSLGYESLDEAAMRLLADEGLDIHDLLTDDPWAFMPLLPDDEQPLPEQAAALAGWCQGLMLGIGLSGVRLHPDELELVETVQHIAQLDVLEISEADEEQAAELTELTEFVRMIPASLREAHTPQPAQVLTLGQTDAPVLPPVVDARFSPDDDLPAGNA